MYCLRNSEGKMSDKEKRWKERKERKAVRREGGRETDVGEKE